MKKQAHLRRLPRVFTETPLYFVTTCTYGCRSILKSDAAAAVLREEWLAAGDRHGWVTGRYVIMPDHVHFFCRPRPQAKTLSQFMAAWKQWTAKRLIREIVYDLPVWQAEFFDHVLRSSESYAQKWEYVRGNPLRAGLVTRAEDWPWQGEIEILSV